ncbi:tRNA (32-2'-O)-methyltransferase regulator THADA-like [Salvelinus alpinus]
MHAAVLGFTSPVWAVSISSALLFNILIMRIFGMKKGKDKHSKKNSDGGQVILYPSLFLLLLVWELLFPMERSSSTLGLAPFMPFIR